MEAEKTTLIAQQKTYHKPMRIRQPFISRPYGILFQSNIPSMGLVQPPLLSPPLSYPPYSPQQPPQPPLLPLPATYRRRSSSSRGTYCFPANGNGKKLTRSPSGIPKKEEKKTPKKSDTDIVLKELSKNIVEVSHFNSMGNICCNENSSSGFLKDVEDQADVIPGPVVFTISPPPPSSLPLPTFSNLRPKLSCNAVAAEIDTGATDNLRRFLRLQ